MRDFDDWLDTFKKEISNYSYYVDFNKVYKNVDEIKIEINILNSLIASKNIKKEFLNLVEKYPEILKVIPILLAVRNNEIYIMEDKKVFEFDFNYPNYSNEAYASFMEKSGLFNLLENRLISNLFDYITGVEVGLDSNGRKNRGGHLMEDLVEGFLKESKVNYLKEVRSSEVEEKLNVDLGSLTHSGKNEKRFDFVAFSEKGVFLIETNFYRSGGSKLNETARSYKGLGLEAAKIDGVNFLWVTDGKGWKTAKNNLRETFESTEHVYNIFDLEKGIFQKLFF